MKFNCSYKEIIDASSLKPNPKNPNKHSKDQIERLAKIIEYQGQRSPIVVSNQSGFITKGHGRLEAMKKLGWKRVAVDFQDYESDEQEYSDIVADNAIAEWSELDFSMINSDLTDLGPDFDIDLLGLKDFEIDVADKELGDEEETPEPPKESKVVKGEVYILGDHRLMCGDSTVITDVEKLMNGEKADMVFTDPPYGVDYQGGHNKKKRLGIKNDALAGNDLTDLFADSLNMAYLSTKDHAAFYIWFSTNKAVETFKSFDKLPLKVRSIICWYKVKSGLGAFMAQYIPNFEPCIYAFKENCTPQWFGPSDEKSVWEQKKDSKNEFHPTQKPIDLPERAINNSSKKDDIVLDVFGGSGSTLIACEKTNRKCYMMELDEYYCHVILERWQKYTGRKAIREDGKLWDEIKEVSNG